MDILDSNSSAVNPISPDNAKPESVELHDCCKATIDAHAANNPMMVCSECKQVIKYFEDEKAFRNYCSFCSSRNRHFLATFYNERHFVIFKSYDLYSK